MRRLVLDIIDNLISYIEPEKLEIFDSEPCSRTITLRKLKKIRSITEEVAIIRGVLNKMGVPNDLDEIVIGIDDEDKDVLDMVNALREMLFDLPVMIEAFFEELDTDSE